MIHLVTWLPLPYQRTLCRTLDGAYGDAFVAWFAERTHKEFPYRVDPEEQFSHHYLAEVGYGKLCSALWSDPEAVIILCGWSSPMTNKTLLLAALLRIPLFIWTDHPHPRQRSTVLGIARRTFLHLLARRVSGFLACGKPTVEHLVSLGFEASKITNFPYWVELPSEWSVPERCSNEAASRRPLRLLAIGRHVPIKRLDVAIEAVALANRRSGMQLAELVLAGDGSERGRLETLSQSAAPAANVTLTNWLEPEEIREQIRKADAVVITSQFEPYGVVVLEAMACGRPVLASEGVMAARDRDDGTGAVLLHPVGDIECLAGQIGLLARDPGRVLQSSTSARATAEKWPPERAISILDPLLNRLGSKTLLSTPRHHSGIRID